MNSMENEFFQLVEDHFKYNVQTTESDIVCTFCTALIMNTHCKQHEILLEYNHPNLSKNERVDVYIPYLHNHGMIMECKYDRNQTKNSPRPKKAGKVFNDLFRLALFNNGSFVRKCFIYITDNEMACYFKNQKNGLNNFFNLDIGKTLQVDSSYLTTKPQTFKNNCSTYNIQLINITSVFKKELPNNHKIRIYDVL